MPIDLRVDNKVASKGSLGTAPYMAKIVGFADPQYQGGIEVSLMRDSGNQIADETQTYVVRYSSPFYGATAYEFQGKNVTHDDSQKSYGFWGVPPDIGVSGIVIFIGGDPAAGYWISCIQDKFTNHMIPAIGGTKNYNAESDYDQAEHPLPVAEHNRKANEMDKSLEIDKIPRGVHPIANRFKEQGLIRDEFRGTSTSSARRDVPAMVFGMSSPGPLDRAGKKSYVGNKQSSALIPVSRLGGTQFVMDDGDDRYFREQKASDGPPNYIKDGGDFNLPYNEHFRIRTRTGHQFLLHNTEDFIYIGNSRGTAWVELSSDGKIDIFSQDSISVRTKQDFNFFCDRDFNLEVGRNMNVKVNGERHIHVLKDDILIVDENQKIHIKQDADVTVNKAFKHNVKGDSNTRSGGNYTHTIVSNYDLNIGGHNFQTSGGSNETFAGGQIVESSPVIYMNEVSAAVAGVASVAQIPKVLKLHSMPDLGSPSAKTDPSDLITILRRVPTPEAYPHHENLDPSKFRSSNLDRDSQGRYEGQTSDLRTPPTEWKKYKKPGDNPF